jgi:hypothetical protein
MAYVSSAVARSAIAQRSFEIPKTVPRAKRSLLLRLLDAIEEANMHRAEREIARYLGTTGGKITDDIERQIERRFLAK